LPSGGFMMVREPIQEFQTFTMDLFDEHQRRPLAAFMRFVREHEPSLVQHMTVERFQAPAEAHEAHEEAHAGPAEAHEAHEEPAGETHEEADGAIHFFDVLD